METNFYSILQPYNVELHSFTKEMLLEIVNVQKYTSILSKNEQIIYINNFKLFLQKRTKTCKQADDLRLRIGNAAEKI